MSERWVLSCMTLKSRSSPLGMTVVPPAENEHQRHPSNQVFQYSAKESNDHEDGARPWPDILNACPKLAAIKEAVDYLEK
jgi:hypothetical protein